MAEDGKTTESRPVDTVKVAVIGTGDASRLDSGVVAVTPGQHQPNLVTQVVTPLMALAVRFGYAWCTAFVGGVTTAGLLSGKLNQTEAVPIIELAALFATMTAGVDLIKNAATVFSGLEKRFPLASGSV